MQIERKMYIFLRDLPNKREDILTHISHFIVEENGQKILENIFGKKSQNNLELLAKTLENTEFRNKLLSGELHIALQVLSGGEAAFAIDGSDKTDTSAYKI